MRWIRPRGIDIVMVVAAVVSIALLLSALGLNPDEPAEWLAGVLVNVGAAGLLVAPIYLLNRRLDQRIESVREETKSSVAAISDRVTAFEHDVEQRLDDLSASVEARLEQEQQRDLDAFSALTRTPGRGALLDALKRADDLGLISRKRGPRVCVSDYWNVYVRVDFDPAQNSWGDRAAIEFVVEAADGTRHDRVPWAEEVAVDEILFRVGRAVQRVTDSGRFDVTSLFGGICNALVVAHSHPDRRPVWQLCGPQWMVTNRAIATYGDSTPYSFTPYTASFERLAADIYFKETIRRKPWTDEDSLDQAYAVAMALFEPEPPF